MNKTCLLTTYESIRLDIQATLDERKTRLERNRLGQFGTPTELAREMLTYAATLLPEETAIRFLDPAFGTGSFYSALLEAFEFDRVIDAEGYELDSHYGQPASELWKDTELRLHLEDFTRATPPKSNANRFNLVICNPPYVRHHHLAIGEKSRLQTLSERACGVKIGGLAGLYCYFLSLAHPWMTEDGIAGWLIPSEFMDVGYGEALKRYLLDQVTLLHIHRFDPDETQFKDALVSSAVVWFLNRKPALEYNVKFTFGGTLMNPTYAKTIPTSLLRGSAKWTHYPLGNRLYPTPTELTIGDLFLVKRGLATGHNDFFLLTREQIEKRGLPLECFRPVLPSPRFLDANEVFADEAGNPILNRPLFLLDCRLQEHVVKIQYPSLWTYFEEGKAQGIHERYLCRHRSPWYTQEQRPSARLLCTYMGRRDGKNGKPFRFILNHSQATATNVYLIMYPRPWLARELDVDPTWARAVWQILNDLVPNVLIMNGRVYGGGLYKLEPRELMGIPAGSIFLRLLDHRQSKIRLSNAELREK